ncbi:YtxH domain-containing protein [Marinilactibacillus kalidii]|uniref:YtxH domain-containing protein n=1 Tax=Marinilactibacillus kalidii TaxID=2820274 RepID=UPI001ABE679E|nr:YtxH domain-containing protein [Marinilactibacillus kalidii]
MKHFLLGSLSGIILGGTYGLLTTPRSGKENQEKLKNYVDDTTDHVKDVNDKVGDLKVALQNLTDEGVKLQIEFITDIQALSNEYMYEAQPRIERIQRKTDKISKDIEAATVSIKSTTIK